MKTTYKKLSISEISKLKSSHQGIKLEGLSSWGVDLPNKNFNGCLLKDIKVESSHMENNAWSRTRGENLSFKESVIQGSIFSYCVLPETNFESCVFEGVSFFSSIFRGSNFKRTSFEGCSFEGANFQDCDFRGADLSTANLYDCASLMGAIFDRSTKLPFSINKALEMGMTQRSLKLAQVSEAEPSIEAPTPSPSPDLPHNVIDLSLYRNKS